MEKYFVDRSQAGTTLSDFIAQLVPCSKKQAKRMLDSRRVFVNGRRVWIASHQLGSGDKIELPEQPSKSTQQRKASTLKALWRGERFLILNKPAGSLSNGSGSFESAVSQTFGNPNLQAVHRLDRDTTGCMIFAQDPEAFERMKDEFVAHNIQKTYLALVKGTPRFETRTVRSRIDGKSAVSHFKVREKFKYAALLEVELETGRMHQIRIHLKELGLPILGDTRYANMQESDVDLRSIPRQMLHASRISFKEPFTGNTVSASAPIPDDFKAAIAVLKGM